MATTASGAIIQMRVEGAETSQRQIAAVSQSMNRLADTVHSSLANLAATIGIGGGIAQIIQLSDQYTKFTAQLRLATMSAREYGQAMASVKAISTNAQTSMGELGTLYARIANGTRELGTTQKQVANITETVALALKVSGATAQESSSAMLQLSQSFASGTLRGEEFNAVNEAAPRLMLALADGIGVPVGALKEMASNGQITSKIMADVLPNALAKLRVESKEIQTISGAFQVLKDRMMEVTAVRAKDNGSVSALTMVIGLLADNLSTLLTVMTGLSIIKAATWAAEWVAATVARVSANRALIASTIESAGADLRRATADRSAALISQSRAREAVASARVEVVADQQRMASAALAAEAAIAARLAQFTETRVIVMAEIELEKVRLAAQINSIGRTQRVAELARLSTQVTAINAGMAASSTELAAVRVANEAAAANAAVAGAAKIAAARELEVVATGGAAAATLRMRVATGAMSVAMAAGSVAAGVLRGALALLGGPIGAIITILTLGGLAWMTWGKKAADGAKEVKATLATSTKEVIDQLEKQIGVINERNRLMGVAPKLAKAETPASDQMRALTAEINRIEKDPRLTSSEKVRQANVLARQYSTIASSVDRLTVAQEKNADGRFNEKYAKWLGQNGTAAQKTAYELDELRKEYGRVTPEMEKFVREKNADKGAASSIKKEADAYATLISSIQSKTAENRQELAIGESVSESQKLTIKLDQQLATGKLKLSDAHQATARSALAELVITEQSLKAAEAQRDITKYVAEGIIARQQSVDALDVEYQAYGKNADAREMLMVSVKAETDMQMQLRKLKESNLPVSDATVARLENERDARIAVETAMIGQTKALQYAAQLTTENKQYAAESLSDPRARAMALLQIDVNLWQERIKNAGAGTEAQKLLQTQYDTWYANRLKGATVAVDLTQATQLLDIMAALDDAAKSAAEGMANSFGQVGTAIGGLTTTLTGYGRTQAAIAAQLAAATKDSGGDTGKIARANAVAAQQSAQAQMKSYGDMAGAAKGFFKSNSAGYRAMEGVEKTYRAFEMAMAIKNMIAKSGLLEAFTGLFVASKATETAATVASVAPDIAASMAKGTAAAAAGVAGQAAGDPYTAWARMAAMAAAMAALGFAVAGGNSGGGGATAAEVQKSQGTGSVFGDSSAKSNSIARGIELSASNSNIQLDYTSGMLAALKSIDASMSGLTNLVVGATGVTDGTNLGIQTGIVSQGLDGILGSITNVLAKVPLIGGLVGGLANLWGKTTQNIVDSGLQLGGSVSDLQNGKGFQQYASVDTTKSSWFGLSKNTSNSVKTAGLDDSLSSQFGLIFQDLEVALDTAAGGLGVREEEVTKALQNLVIAPTKVSLKDLKGDDLTAAINGVISKTMDGMAAAAFPGLDRFRKVGEGYAETVMRLATDSAKLDGILGGIGGSFGATGIASLDARESLISMAGGIDELASKTKDFAGNYLSQAEQLAPVQQYLTERMTAMGLAAVQTRDDFKKVVLGLVESGALATAAGAQQYTELMELQEAFAKTHAATVDLTMSEQAIADQRKDLQKKYDELTKTTAQLHADERDTIPDVNLALYDQVYAQQQLKDAATAASEALKSTVERLISTQTSTLAYRDSLMTGSLSTLTPMQKYLETQRQYAAALAKSEAKPDDTGAASAAQAAATAFLTASQVVNASSAAYVNDRANVLSDMTKLADIAGAQITDAQKQLDVATQQVTGIATLNTTAVGIQQAIIDLAKGGTVVQAPALDMSTYTTASNESQAVLVVEIKRLNASMDEMKKAMVQRNVDARDQHVELVSAVDEVAPAVGEEIGVSANQARFAQVYPASVKPR